MMATRGDRDGPQRNAFINHLALASFSRAVAALLPRRAADETEGRSDLTPQHLLDLTR